jgi:hypothetical protein
LQFKKESVNKSINRYFLLVDGEFNKIILVIKLYVKNKINRSNKARSIIPAQSLMSKTKVEKTANDMINITLNQIFKVKMIWFFLLRLFKKKNCLFKTFLFSFEHNAIKINGILANQQYSGIKFWIALAK